MKKHLVASLLATSSILLSAAPVLAQGNTPMRDMAKENIQNRMEVRVENRCNVVEARVKNIVGRYDTNYPRHVQKYKEIAENVQKVVSVAKQNGKDTTKLEAVLKTLNEKILTLDQQVKAATAQLTVAQQYGCGESQGKFAEEMKKARELAQTVHKTMLDIRSYYQSSVRPEVQALRSSR